MFLNSTQLNSIIKLILKRASNKTVLPYDRKRCTACHVASIRSTIQETILTRGMGTPILSRVAPTGWGLHLTWPGVPYPGLGYPQERT